MSRLRSFVLPPAATLRADFTASLVVFLVALPLCVGVAVASGVPAELGLVTGIVGGLVTGLLPGSSLQVSGPAAGLTVLVYTAVQDHGLAALGVITAAAGLLQIAMGTARLGRLFRAISLSVVQGMLAGIGLVLIAGQLYAAIDAKAPAGGIDKITHLPAQVADAVTNPQALTAAAVALGTLLILVLWPRLPAKARLLPAPLAAVAAATGAAVLFDPDIAVVEVAGLADVIHLPGGADLTTLATPAAAGTALAFALIASAESLFSAAAVDRLHNGPRTHYDKELLAQGAGNTLCGLLGALPMTAVIVRSAANVHAGARTKASRVLHGLWLLLFTALIPAALSAIPLAALAAVLLHAGAKLIPVKTLLPLWRTNRGEALILTATAGAIVVTNLLEGVLLGLLLSVLKTAWDTSHLTVDVTHPDPDTTTVTLTGNATFLRLPRLLDTLEHLPTHHTVQLDLTHLRHLDHACRSALETWEERHNRTGQAEVVRVPVGV